MCATHFYACDESMIRYDRNFRSTEIKVSRLSRGKYYFYDFYRADIHIAIPYKIG